MWLFNYTISRKLSDYIAQELNEGLSLFLNYKHRRRRKKIPSTAKTSPTPKHQQSLLSQGWWLAFTPGYQSHREAHHICLCPDGTVGIQPAEHRCSRTDTSASSPAEPEVSPDPLSGEAAPTHLPLGREGSWSSTTFEDLFGEAGQVKPGEGEARWRIRGSDLGCWGIWEWRAVGMLHLPVSTQTAPSCTPCLRGHCRWHLKWRGLLFQKCSSLPQWASMSISPRQIGDKKLTRQGNVFSVGQSGPPAAPRRGVTVPWGTGWEPGGTQD